ncbi:MAG: pyrroloquinoline quinone biosynthesis protein PqqE [Myxococcota bacterium]
MTAPRPYNLVAELTYRCPLRCVYCSNPLEYAQVREQLDGAAWSVVMEEAAALGVVHVGLTGGEPTLHPDLLEIVTAAANADLYPHLVTAGTTLDREGLEALARAGLRSVQLSIQSARADTARRVAGVDVATQKARFAADVRALDLPLTVNVVLHRDNLDEVPELVGLADQFGAKRLELANTQYHGWALRNRDALLPTRAALDAAASTVERMRAAYPQLEILFVLPDYLSDRPKPCMGGWGQRIVVVAPDGKVLPCHGAAELPGLEFWRVPERALGDCWRKAPGMNAYRGDAWMQPPCRTCPERQRDFAGCRCQAFALTGDAAATDPACSLAPAHGRIVEARDAAEADPPALVYRGGLS